MNLSSFGLLTLAVVGFLLEFVKTILWLIIFENNDFLIEDVLTSTQQIIKMQAGANWSSAEFLGSIPLNLKAKGYDLIGGKQNYSSGDFSEPRLFYNANVTSYGIVFVPSSVPGGGGGAPGVLWEVLQVFNRLRFRIQLFNKLRDLRRIL